MNLEEEIFKYSEIDFNKLVIFGFKETDNGYIYENYFMDNEFKAVISIDKSGILTGTVYDVQNNEEYLLLRVKNHLSAYAEMVRAKYTDILISIKENCSYSKYFILPQANRITKSILKKYNVSVEFPWKESSNHGVFRNFESKKWFAIILNINKNKINKNQTGETEIINVKLDTSKIFELLEKDGFYPAYHMNKKNWITMVLDETLPDKTIMEYVDISYKFSNQKKKNKK